MSKQATKVPKPSASPWGRPRMVRIGPEVAGIAETTFVYGSEPSDSGHYFSMVLFNGVFAGHPVWRLQISRRLGRDV